MSSTDAPIETPTPDQIMQLGMGYWGSKTLLSAVEVGVFAALVPGPLPLEELRRRLDLHPRSARDFFDALVALGVLDRDGEQEPCYRNTAETDLFLDPAKPSYIGGMLEVSNSWLYRFWGSLTQALRTGEPQNDIACGEDPFAELYADPDRLAEFLTAMSGASAGSAVALANTFPWERYQSFCDLGCAQGMVPAQVALRHEHLRGIGFDLPQVAPIFEKFIAGYGLSSRVSFHSGDFFTGPLPEAQVYVMGHILHDWGMDAKRSLLRRTCDALPEGGALIVYETLIDDDRRANAFGLLMSLNMLINSPDGFDYTGADCRSWMAEAGFRDSYVQHLAGPESMVVGFK
jgi:hypothetical protein